MSSFIITLLLHLIYFITVFVCRALRPPDNDKRSFLRLWTTRANSRWPELRETQQQMASAWPEIKAAQQEDPEEPEDRATQQEAPEPNVEDEADDQA
jgi:hypothetical protein